MMRPIILATFAALALVACDNAPSAQTSIDAGLAPCEEYVASYRACLGKLGNAQEADQRVAIARAALVASASKDEAARAAVLDKCAAGVVQLRRACP